MLVTETGRRTFDRIAEDYDAVRPAYPAAMVAELVARTRLTPASSLLEIACGTGQLTRLLAPACRITAIDMGENLLNVARRNCAAFPNVSFVCAKFEDFAADAAERFEAVACATAFHWLDPATRWSDAAKLLRPGGTLAIIQNVNKFGADTGGLRSVLHDIYTRVIPPELMAQYQNHEARTEGLLDEFRARPEFGAVTAGGWPYIHTLATADYLRLLNSFSYQHNLPPPVKERLFAEIAAAIDRDGGLIHLAYEATMFTARRL